MVVKFCLFSRWSMNFTQIHIYSFDLKSRKMRLSPKIKRRKTSLQPLFTHARTKSKANRNPFNEKPVQAEACFLWGIKTNTWHAHECINCSRSLSVYQQPLGPQNTADRVNHEWVLTSTQKHILNTTRNIED